MRIDKYLVLNNSFQTRTKATEAINKGLVLVNGKQCSPSYIVKETDDITIDDLAYKYVSRGGFKLEGAIKAFNLDFKDYVVVDIGASTGGFTDCALKHGAKLVYAVDVGRDQLDSSLKSDKRVISLEETNFIDIDKDFENDIFVMDVSFVSITKILPSIWKKMENRQLVTLIKPQFEAGKIKFKNGVLHDTKKHEEILRDVLQFAKNLGFILRGLIVSPIKGKSGNIEYLAYFKDKGQEISVDIRRFVNNAFKE